MVFTCLQDSTISHPRSGVFWDVTLLELAASFMCLELTHLSIMDTAW